MDYPARLVRVVDGDTQHLYLEERHPFLDREEVHIAPSQGVRLLGVWCPEPREAGGPEATAAATDWYARHDHPEEGLDLLCLSEPRFDSFRRLLGVVRCRRDNACLNEDLLAEGHATPNKTTLHRDSLRALVRAEGAASPAGRLLLKATATP